MQGILSCFLLRNRAFSCETMPGKPFRSKIEPFYDLIVQARRNRMTWEEIAETIRQKGTACTRQAVQDYFKRHKTLRHPMGMEPQPEAPKRRPTDPTPKQPDNPAQAMKRSPQEMEEEFLKESAKRQNKPTAFPIADLDE